MKSKLLPLLLFLLIILNGVLIFMLINKSHKNKKAGPDRNFLTEQLQFSDTQKEQFREFDMIHRDHMKRIDRDINVQKEVLFNSFSKEKINIDSLTNKIGILEGKKEAEVFNFFNKVRILCTIEQAKKFDQIIKKALKGGKKRPPRDGRMPPPNGEKHHPSK